LISAQLGATLLVYFMAFYLGRGTFFLVEELHGAGAGGDSAVQAVEVLKFCLK
jgi:hypothetical protein